MPVLQPALAAGCCDGVFLAANAARLASCRLAERAQSCTGSRLKIAHFQLDAFAALPLVDLRRERQAALARLGPQFLDALGPPAGPSHHYAFELYAVDQKLDLPLTATRADVMKALDGHISAHAALIVPYHQ